MRVPSTKVQNNFGRYLKYVQVNEEITVTKNGKDVARILPCEDSADKGVMEGAAEYVTSGDWVTYDEFMELIENSEQRFELIDGVVYNMSSPSYKHQYAVHEIFGVFYNFFKGKACTPLTSPFDITFQKSEDNICVVQPDIIVICDKENINKKDEYKGIPSLLVEVLSPSTRGKDMLKKLDLYKQSGVKEYWIADTQNEQITIYSFNENDITDSKAYVKGANEFVESAYFGGLKVALKDVFA